MKTTFCSLGWGKATTGDIRQYKMFRDLVRKNLLHTNFLKIYYYLIIILWSIFLTVILVDIWAYSGLNLTASRTCTSTSYFMFILEKTSSMYFSWIITQIFKVELEPGQSDGSGSSQIPRLRGAPAPKPWYNVKKLDDTTNVKWG